MAKSTGVPAVFHVKHQGSMFEFVDNHPDVRDKVAITLPDQLQQCGTCIASAIHSLIGLHDDALNKVTEGG